MLKRPVVTVVAALAIGLASPPIDAFEAATEPRAFIGDLGERAIDLLNAGDMTGDARKDGLAELFSAAFDVKAMARFVVARHWRTMNARQKEAYIETFRDYVVNAYADKFAGYAGHTFEVYQSRDINAAESLVSAAVVEPNGSLVEIGFRVRAKGGRLSIVDVSVRGVSLLLTKRSEFTSVIEREGPDGLIQRLKKLEAKRADHAA